MTRSVSFYAIVDVPMTENNVYVKKTDNDLLKITDSTIAKAILFLYPAEGIDEQGAMPMTEPYRI